MNNRFEITFPFGPNDKVIELGGGDNPRFRPNVDIRRFSNVDYVTDLNDPTGELGTMYREFDGVFSHYALEHVSWRNVHKLIKLTYDLLKPGGVAMFIIPNLVEQAKYVVARAKADEFGDNEVCCIFGDQNYEGANWRANSHTAGFSPWSITKLFRDAGFESVLVVPHPATDTDMVVEARKPLESNFANLTGGQNAMNTKTGDRVAPEARGLSKEEYERLSKMNMFDRIDDALRTANNFTTAKRREAYGHDYFNGGGQYGGYAREGYWDYPVHRKTAQDLMNLKPTSVLEIGPARGYVLKRLEDQGVRCKGLEVSRHCFLTRVTDAVVEFDVTQTPWPFKDKEFDLCFSNAVMEHIPEQYLPAIFAEMERVTKRGFHSISFKDDDDGFDKTHTTLHDAAWWKARLPQGHDVLDKEIFERGPIPPEPGDGKVKLNFGSHIQMFSHGWHNLDALNLSGFANQYGFRFNMVDVAGLTAKKPLPFADDSVDLIFSSHMLEHLTVDDGAVFLRECYRIMKPGATMRLIVPDTDKLAELYVCGDLFELDALLPPQDAALMPSMKLFKFLADGHKTAYNWDSLGPMLNVAGFKNVERKSFRRGHQQILRETHESLPELSLYVEAVK